MSALLSPLRAMVVELERELEAYDDLTWFSGGMRSLGDIRNDLRTALAELEKAEKKAYREAMRAK